MLRPLDARDPPEPALLKRSSGGALIAYVPKGRHELLVEGKIGGRDEIVLPVDGVLHNVLVATDNEWRVSGVDERFNATGQIRITRKDSGKPSPSGNVQRQQGRVPGFLIVERRFVLGLKWKIRTRVVRVSSNTAPVLTSFPLLPGERIVSGTVKMQRGAKGRRLAVINLPEGKRELSWVSSLDLAPRLELKALQDSLIMEKWIFQVGEMWRFSYSGIPPLLDTGQKTFDSYVPVWKPWPSETLTLTFSRPSPRKGPTLTSIRCRLTQKPGRKITVSSLDWTLRSSLGGSHTVRLPAGSKIRKFVVDGRNVTFDPEQPSVAVPLHPGNIHVQLEWIEPRGMSRRFRTTPVDLGLPLSNIRIDLEYPRDRWILMTGGPQLGPAVLFWGSVVVVLALAAVLGRISGPPMGFVGWSILGIGLMPVSIPAAFVVTGWLMAFHLRARHSERIKNLSPWLFNLIQVGLLLLTLAGASALLYAVQQGLLGSPDMRITGNGSHAGFLSWYQDRASRMPSAWAVSLSIWSYRAAMLFWALWLSFNIVRWGGWGWNAFCLEGAWKRMGWKGFFKRKGKDRNLSGEERADSASSERP